MLQVICNNKASATKPKMPPNISTKSLPSNMSKCLIFADILRLKHGSWHTSDWKQSAFIIQFSSIFYLHLGTLMPHSVKTNGSVGLAYWQMKWIHFLRQCKHLTHYRSMQKNPTLYPALCIAIKIQKDLVKGAKHNKIYKYYLLFFLRICCIWSSALSQ